MRALLILVSLLPFLAHCQESEPFVANPDSCVDLLIEGDAYTKEAINRATMEQWDTAFPIIDEGFFRYLRGTTVCETPNDLKQAEALLAQNRRLAKTMTCTYHILNMKDEATRAKLAYEQIRDYDQTILHMQSSLYSAEEAQKWCPEEEQDKLREAKNGIILGMAELEENHP